MGRSHGADLALQLVRLAAGREPDILCGTLVALWIAGHGGPQSWMDEDKPGCLLLGVERAEEQ